MADVILTIMGVVTLYKSVGEQISNRRLSLFVGLCRGETPTCSLMAALKENKWLGRRVDREMFSAIHHERNPPRPVILAKGAT